MWPSLIDDFLPGLVIVQPFYELNESTEINRSRKKNGTGLLTVCLFLPTTESVC